MEEEKKIKYEVEPKPEIEGIKEIIPDTSDFTEPEKAEALIKSLSLSVGTRIKEFSDGEQFIINPRMVLRGDSQEKYKQEIEEVKKILTENEQKQISLYYKRKKEDKKTRDKIYYGITKRVEKLYKWDDENKKHIPKTNSKRSLEICECLDWIYNNNNLSGFANLIYHILSKDKSDFVECYKCAWKNKPIPNIQKWKEENEGEYMVLTESEADTRANEYLVDDDYLWKMAVENGQTTDSLEDWAKWVLNSDGRSNILNSYDGNEETEEINGVTYCIYRTN